MKYPLVSAVAIALSTLASTPALAAVSTTASTTTSQTTQVVIEFSGATLSANSLSQAANAKVIYEASVGIKTRVYEVQGSAESLELAQNIKDLEALPGVSSAEIDLRVYPMTAPNDPLLGGQWALDSGYGVDAVTTWQSAQGEGVRVAVVDTGVVAHEDLASNVVGGYDFISDSTTANDGDGRDGDPTDAGDWAANEVCGYASNSSWHGTHVAGIIAAVNNNGIGVSGVAPKATIVPVRALGRCGGSTSDVFAAARWAAGLSVPGVPSNSYPARIINMSLGSAQACPSWMQSAIDEIAAVGVLIVVAAGNANVDAATTAPASCNNVLTVASSTSQGARSSFSNYGSAVDIAAPGSGVLNTINLGTTVAGNSGYEQRSGTSMAAPHVAGVAALVLSLEPDLSLADLRSRLLSTATAFSSTCSECGAGIVSASGAVAPAVSALLPGAPTSVTAIANQVGVRVAWTAPTSNGGSAITGYVISGGSGCETAALWCDMTGLTPGVEQQFSVRAENTHGLGPASTVVSAVFLTAPSSPHGVTATLTSELTAQVSWSAPSSNGGSVISKYVVTGAPTGMCETATYACVFSDLAPGTTYTFHVYAVNASGSGTSATSSVVQTAAGPATPIALNIEIAGLRMVATWSQGQGGLSTLNYVMSVSPGNHLCETTTTTCVIEGLTSGTQYSVSLVARGPQSTTSSALEAMANTLPASNAPGAPTTTSPEAPATTAPVQAPTPTPAPESPPAPEVVATPAPTSDPAPESPPAPEVVAAPAPTPTTTATPVASRPPSSSTKEVTVRKGSSMQLSKIMTVPSKARATWSVTGGCRIKGKTLIARKTAGRCTVTLTTNTKGVKKKSIRTVVAS